MKVHLQYESEQEQSMAERLWLSVNATIRQEFMGYWARIASLEFKLKLQEAELFKSKLENSGGNDVY